MDDDQIPQRKWHEPHGAEFAADEPEFMAEYGRAMADWGSLEHQLGQVFGLAVQANPFVTGAVFFAVPGFRDKLAIVSAAIAVTFSAEESVLTAWRAVTDKCAKVNRDRNRIAHMHVWQGPDSGTWGAQDLWKTTKLPVNWNERKQHVVTSGELRNIRARFNVATKEIMSFRSSADDTLRLGNKKV